MTPRLTTDYAKNYCNRTLIVKVIVENVVTCFLLGHSVEMTVLLLLFTEDRFVSTVVRGLTFCTVCSPTVERDRRLCVEKSCTVTIMQLTPTGLGGENKRCVAVVVGEVWIDVI